MLTLDHRIKDLYHHPVGHDVLAKILLQLGLSEKWVDNPLIRNIPLKRLPLLTRGRVDRSFLEAALVLLNSEPDVPRAPYGQESRAWWKEAVFYQIYPRSFQDSNGDGIGDLPGIVARLDYLETLGVDAIWLSPVYDSPNDDNGYDIRDYRQIMADFGTMADFDALLTEIHRRGMKLIMDLVVNHTSDEHAWFRQAVEEPNSPYGDYYIFRDEPNNWVSLFGGPAWEYVPERDQYALHLFSRKQMDLNWDNPNVRADIAHMVRSWLGKGVDGFRLDVINFISKAEGLPDGNETIGQIMQFYGIEHYFYGPNLHRYLKELRSQAFAPYDAFSVGETPGIGLEMGKLLTAPHRQELDMIFSFDHLENPGRVRSDDYRYDLNYYKKYMIRWMEDYAPVSQMSLFYDNHDNPRMLSKIDPEGEHRSVLAKLLALLQLTLKGTPFIFQGQELGMMNNRFRSIQELRDVESLNLYQSLLETNTPEEAFHKVLAGTRDHARTPMQWTDEEQAGFTEGTSWIPMDDDHRTWNAAAQADDPDSVLNFYRKLIAIRKDHDSLIYGSIEFTERNTPNLFACTRQNEEETLCVLCNLSGRELKYRRSHGHHQVLISNYPGARVDVLRPYEAILWRAEQ